VAHDTVQAEACEQGRETGPEPGEAGQQAVLREDVAELLINRVDADDREERIDPAKCFTNRALVCQVESRKQRPSDGTRWCQTAVQRRLPSFITWSSFLRSASSNIEAV
jgi:hypothetical protein